MKHINFGSLETRIHCAVNVFDRTLVVEGTDGADTVIITREVVDKSVVYRVSLNGAVTDSEASAIDSTYVDTGAGNDRVELGRIPETLIHLGDGDDLAIAGPVHTALHGDAGNDSLVGGAGDDQLFGEAGNDTCRGMGGNDVLIAQDDQGADILDGGSGWDWGDYEDRSEDLSLSLNGIADDGASGEGDNLLRVERILTGWGKNLVVGSSRGELIEIEGPGDTVFGMGGNDTIKGLAGNDSLVGGSGDDVIFGYAGRDSLFGQSGDDKLYGQAGADLLDGGSGTDLLSGGFGSDTLFGGAGDDRLFATDFNGVQPDQADLFPAGDLLSGGSGTDLLTYSNASAAINLSLDGIANDGQANEGDLVQSDIEQFEGSAFADHIDLSGTAGRRRVQSGAGDDTIIGGNGADLLNGDAGNDSITGGPGEDRIFAGEGDDIIIANDGIADILNGRAGLDTAIADAGIDTLYNIEA